MTVGDSYSVVVTNVAGTATSSGTALTVLLPPTITSQPRAQTVVVGTTVTLATSATGDGAILYQWLFDEAPLAGATNSTLRLEQVRTNSSGAYRAVVSNPYGAVTTAIVLVAVLVGDPLFRPPRI